jgi:DNA-binding LacI/PurR family transcriptional regulator
MLSSADDSVAEKYIGIILAGNYMFKRPFYGDILASIHEQAHEKDRHIRFIRCFEDFSNPALFNELIHPNEISGVILVGVNQALRASGDKALVEEIVKRVERVVCLDWEWPGVPSVLFDRHNAAFQATDHLLSSGRLHIAYIGPDDQRVAGYHQALWRRGITPEKGYLYFGNTADLGYAGCSALIQSGLPLDGICAGSDEVGIGILNCLHQSGRRIPDGVAVASIDNIDIAAFTVPPLTTVDVPKRDMGLHVIDVLTSDESWKQSSAFTIMVPTQLIIRESSV